MGRTDTRRRSRSRSPILRGPRSVVTKAKPVNMLDVDTVEKVRTSSFTNRGSSSGSKPYHSERITCTISGPNQARDRVGVSNRLSGGSYGRREREVHSDDRRRSGGDSRQSFGERSSVRDRLSFGNGREPLSFGNGRDSTGERRGEERFDNKDDDRRNGSFRDADKPVQRLIDPASVPKSKFYFDHDDRGGDGDKWRGRTSYDPRIDFGPRRGRHSRGGGRGWDGFGDRTSGGNRDRSGDYNRPRRDDRPYRAPPSKADGLWTHDKFIELEVEEDNPDTNESGEGGVNVVIGQLSPSRRLVEEDAGGDDDMN